MKKAHLVTALALLGVVGFVVYSSLTLGVHRCEVCIEFEGQRACRTVEGTTEDEARTGATTNACALLASGVTQSLRCARTPPLKSECVSLRD